ncbi:cyclase family protein [Owenweeksia hongkongensis]|uniref:cyclase family protein n=1 Tax=Owenweeksia hongkongensis TaxID=253245 RepID=UPI003A90FF3D
MKFTIEHCGDAYESDFAQGIDLSSALGLPGKELKAWWADDVDISPVVNGDWIGSVEKGAPVNFFNIKFNPHGNGSHTETYGHISKEKESVHNYLKKYHFVSWVVSLAPEKAKNGDSIITLEALKKSVTKWDGIEALIIKTGDYKDGHDFSGSNATYFEPELLAFIRDRGVEHVLVDLPSVDREEDEGKLLAHHAFWNYPEDPRDGCTISELLQVPSQTKDGLYLLNLQVASFANDASPCRPVIYPLTKVGF